MTSCRCARTGRLPICAGHERLKDADGQKAHSTQKPESLLHRVIVASTKPGDVILDPFFGSGTTGAVAKRLGRHFIGIEREKTYADVARARIAEVVPADSEVLEVTKSKRAEPRIPFGWVVERGLLPPGTVLHGTAQASEGQGARRRHAGLRRCAQARSIRSARMCRGWTPAMAGPSGSSRLNGALVPIDVLRQRLRAELV